MKKLTLTLLALTLLITAYCGVPQAISYQAVALNASGLPIKNKNVALRMSILANSANGTLTYQERQSTTTDNSGIISIQVGNGSVLSGSFSTIDWSKGVYFLKTEIDTTNGTNYNTVGTVQFFSVPFSLYSANASQANYASIDYPDGLNSITPVNMSGSFSYIVPSGQTLYITQLTHDSSTVCTNYGVAINGVFVASNESGTAQTNLGTGHTNTSTNKFTMNYPLGVPSGYAVNSTSCGTSMVGFTIPTNNSWVIFDLSTGNYTVPAGKVLVIKNMISSTGTTWNGFYKIGSTPTAFSSSAVNFIDQGTTLSTYGLSGSLLMMGYLKNR